MSLSKFYDHPEDFVPETLVPRPPRSAEDWQPVELSREHLAGLRPAAEKEQPQPAESQSEPGQNPEPAGDGEASSAPEPNLEAGPSETSEPPLPPQPDLPDLDQLREEAFAAGVAEGRNQAEADFGAAARSLVQAGEMLNTIRETILQNSKQEMVELVIALAEKIIRHSVTEQDQTIVATVEEAILGAVKSSEFYIYLNPEDVSIIESRAPELIATVNGLEHLIVKKDPTVERGGCKIESDNCTVDATIASQFEIITGRIREENA